MSTITDKAEPAAQKLLKADEGQLLEQLGMRNKAIQEEPDKAGSFDPIVVYDQAEMGLKDEVLELGQRIFRRWNGEAYNLVCGSQDSYKQDRAKLAQAFGISDVAVAASLSALLVTNFGVAPAIAAVVAALIVKRFFRPAFEEFCQVWHKNIQETV